MPVFKVLRKDARTPNRSLKSPLTVSPLVGSTKTGQEATEKCEFYHFEHIQAGGDTHTYRTVLHNSPGFSSEGTIMVFKGININSENESE